MKFERFIGFSCLGFLLLLAACHKSRTRASSTSAASSVCSDSWTGIEQFGVTGPHYVYANSLAVDSACNIYVSGYTDSSLDGVAITGLSDSFLIKFDHTGTKQWTKLFGAAGQTTYATAMAIDDSGNIYLTGIETGDLDGQTLTGTQDSFITKFDSEGTKIWTRLLGVSGEDTFSYAITTDLSGNIYITGETWGDLEGNSMTGFSGVYVAKYDSSGTKEWTKVLSVAAAATSGYAIKTDSLENSYIVGSTMGGLNGNSVTGDFDYYLAKYDSTGNLEWVRQNGVVATNTWGWGLQIDSSGGLFVAGNTSGNLDGIPITGAMDVFVVSYDPEGTKQWTKLLGTELANVLFAFNSTAIDSSDNFYVAGYVDVGFDGNTMVGGTDAFLTKFNQSGDRQWTKQLGASPLGIPLTLPTAVSINENGGIFMTGYTDGSLPNNTVSGTTDSYIVKYDSSGNLQ